MRLRLTSTPRRCGRTRCGGGGPAGPALVLALILTAAAGPAGAQVAAVGDTVDAATLKAQAFTALWSEDAPTAITLFRRHLAATGDADTREARRGLALACSWDGRQDEAAELYRTLLAEDPADGDARVGLGRALLWDNRLRDGWRELRTAEAAGGAGAKGAGGFMLTALDEYTPPLTMALGTIHDSDDLRITRLAATGAFTVGGNRLLQVMPARMWYRQPGQPDAGALRVGLGLVTGLAPRWTLHAFGWLDHFTSDGPLPATAAALDWNPAGGDAWVTWLPAPRWRVDVGAGAQPVETYLALGSHIVRSQGSLSVERRLSRRWSAGLAGVGGDYTDGNRSGRLTARATWRRDGRWALQAGPVLNLLDYSVPYPGAYWAPDAMRSAALEAAVRTRGRVWTARLAGSVAREKETGVDAITVGGISGRFGWRFSRDWLLGIEAGHSTSSYSSASGYRRTSVGVDVRAYF